MPDTTITTTTVTTPKTIREIPKENADAIITEIEKYCRHWSNMADTFNWLIGIFGFIAIVTSVIVSIYTGTEKLISPNILKLLACVSTISLGLLTAFNLVNLAQNARTAWRALNSSLMMYQAGEISIVDLIRQYHKGENQLGVIDFKYGNIQGETKQTTVEEVKTTEKSTGEIKPLSQEESEKAAENVQLEYSEETTKKTGQITAQFVGSKNETQDAMENASDDKTQNQVGSDAAKDINGNSSKVQEDVKSLVNAANLGGDGTTPK